MKIYYKVEKTVTDFNEDSNDWSGSTRDFGIIDKGVVMAQTLKEALTRISNKLVLPQFNAVEDEPGHYETNQVENDASFQDDNGKYLADYNVYLEKLSPIKEVA